MENKECKPDDLKCTVKLMYELILADERYNTARFEDINNWITYLSRSGLDISSKEKDRLWSTLNNNMMRLNMKKDKILSERRGYQWSINNKLHIGEDEDD